MAFVYMLRCADGTFYAGSTRNLELRLEQHASGRGSAYTSSRLPIQLVFFEEDEDIGSAYRREKQIQGWSRRKREALIAGRYGDLPELSATAADHHRAPPGIEPM